MIIKIIKTTCYCGAYFLGLMLLNTIEVKQAGFENKKTGIKPVLYTL